jgi:hypothetical protein
VEPTFIDAVGLGLRLTVMMGGDVLPMPLPQPRELKLKINVRAAPAKQGPSLLIRLIEPPRPIEGSDGNPGMLFLKPSV